MHYRRTAVNGGTYFFTINLFERRGTLLVDNVDVLREVIREVKAKYPFQIDAEQRVHLAHPQRPLQIHAPPAIHCNDLPGDIGRISDQESDRSCNIVGLAGAF